MAELIGLDNHYLTDEPEPIPKDQLPGFARQMGATFTANGYIWEVIDVDETHVHAHVIHEGR